MQIGILSDIHLYRKTDRLLRALHAVESASLLLIAGDLADRADPAQYELLYSCIRQQMGDVPVYCVTGNHDNPARNDAAYRAFEKAINPGLIPDESGAFRQMLRSDTDLIGLNPVYHQKQFFFPEKGRQLAFLKEALNASTARNHILLCHPPLIAHNTQRTETDTPYMPREQNDKLQQVMNEHSRMILISGHTHMAPTVEWDETRHNLYINNGSICPTDLSPSSGQTQQGNVTLLTLDEDTATIRIPGIHTGKVFFQGTFDMAAPFASNPERARQ